MPRVMNWKDNFFNILSFSTPEARVFNLASIFFVLAVVPTKLLIYSPVKCIFKHFILPLIFRGNCPATGLFAGCNCPACGMTRAMSRILHADIMGAWNFNRLVFLVFAVMAFILIKDSYIVYKRFSGFSKQ